MFFPARLKRSTLQQSCDLFYFGLSCMCVESNHPSLSHFIQRGTTKNIHSLYSLSQLQYSYIFFRSNSLTFSHIVVRFIFDLHLLSQLLSHFVILALFEFWKVWGESDAQYPFWCDMRYQSVGENSSDVRRQMKHSSPLQGKISVKGSQTYIETKKPSEEEGIISVKWVEVCVGRCWSKNG